MLSVQKEYLLLPWLEITEASSFLLPLYFHAPQNSICIQIYRFNQHGEKEDELTWTVTGCPDEVGMFALYSAVAQ